MLTIPSEHSVFQMSPDNKPVARVKTGELVRFETLDCFSNALRSEEQTMSAVDWNRINPATGPLYVEDACPGDILKVTVRDIRLDDQGVMVAIPGSGVVGDALDEERTKIVPIRNGKVHFNDRISFDARPMIGVIGTAPQGEAIPTGTPGKHGGNMDCKRIGVGAVLYLPVGVPGALLAMGDLHAAMGDGEIVICGVEIAGAVDVRVDVLKNLAWPLPMVVQKERVMTIASSPTLDEASKTATRNMFDFLRRELLLPASEAGMILSAMGDLRICQIADPLMTARMELPLTVLESYGYSMK